MQIHVLIFSVTWQLPVTDSVTLSCKDRLYILIWLHLLCFPWRHPGGPIATALQMLPWYKRSYSVYLFYLLPTPGNTQNLPAKAGGAHQSANNMQRCHQQAKEMSARPALQLEQVRNSSLKPYHAHPADSATQVMEWDKSSLASRSKCVKVSSQNPLMDVWPFAQRCVQSCEEKELELIRDIKTQIKEKEHVFFDMEAYLPKRNGWVPPVTSKHTHTNIRAHQTRKK